LDSNELVVPLYSPDDFVYVRLLVLPPKEDAGSKGRDIVKE
jgi:hypothetical protein